MAPRANLIGLAIAAKARLGVAPLPGALSLSCVFRAPSQVRKTLKELKLKINAITLGPFEQKWSRIADPNF
jgi:hypothetical protein